jgi:hypothetical protein
MRPKDLCTWLVLCKLSAKSMLALHMNLPQAFVILRPLLDDRRFAHLIPAAATAGDHPFPTPIR